MRLKNSLPLVIVILFVGAAFSALAQAPPAAKGPKPFSPFAIGGGFSGYNPDEGHGHLLGGTLWIDYIPAGLPQLLNGIGVEVEARDLNLDRSSTDAPNHRQDYVGGGLIYSWPHFRQLRPYAKLFMGYGNQDETVLKSGLRYSDSRTVTSGGGGVDFRATRQLWLRVDYEYQSWPTIFKHPDTAIPAGRLNPQGFTVGAIYHF
jgi:opacity protein-like surface antigen